MSAQENDPASPSAENGRSAVTFLALQVSVGMNAGESYPVYRNTVYVVGSGDSAHIRVPNEGGVAPAHAWVRAMDEGLHVDCIRASGRVRVNGKNTRRAHLKASDHLEVGGVVFRVVKKTRVVSFSEGDGEAGADAHSADTGVEEVGAEAADGGAVGNRKAKKKKTSTSTAAIAVVEDGPESNEDQVRARDPDFLRERGKDRAPVPEHAKAPPPIELQHIWFDIRRDHSWKTLALVSTDPQTQTLPIAHIFARMASLDPMSEVLVVDATRVTPSTERRDIKGAMLDAMKQEPGERYDVLDASGIGMNDNELAHLYVPQLLDFIASGSGRHNTVILALGSILDHATVIPIARAVEWVVLCVGLNQTHTYDVKRAVKVIGNERVLGSIAVRPPE